MAVIACPSCRGKTPSTSINCVHCGTRVPVRWKCAGTGKCPKCGGVADMIEGCNKM